MRKEGRGGRTREEACAGKAQHERIYVIDLLGNRGNKIKGRKMRAEMECRREVIGLAFGRSI